MVKRYAIFVIAVTAHVLTQSPVGAQQLLTVAATDTAVSFWLPQNPKPGDSLTIYYDTRDTLSLLKSPDSVTLHWGINQPSPGLWYQPPESMRPPGTVAYTFDNLAVETPMVKDTATGLWKLSVSTVDSIKSIHYVFHDHSPDTIWQAYFTWDNNSWQNWNIYLSPITRVSSSSANQPLSFALFQNYPNPFNPMTTISFTLPAQAIVSLTVFDILGREVATIVSGELQAGTHTRHWNAASMPSGIYFYRLQAGTYSETKKLLLLK